MPGYRGENFTFGVLAEIFVFMSIAVAKGFWSECVDIQPLRSDLRMKNTCQERMALELLLFDFAARPSSTQKHMRQEVAEESLRERKELNITLLDLFALDSNSCPKNAIANFVKSGGQK